MPTLSHSFVEKATKINIVYFDLMGFVYYVKSIGNLFLKFYIQLDA